VAAVVDDGVELIVIGFTVQVGERSGGVNRLRSLRRMQALSQTLFCERGWLAESSVSFEAPAEEPNLTLVTYSFCSSYKDVNHKVVFGGL